MQPIPTSQIEHEVDVSSTYFPSFWDKRARVLSQNLTGNFRGTISNPYEMAYMSVDPLPSHIIGFLGSMQFNPGAHGPHVKAVNCSRPDSHRIGCSAGFSVIDSACTAVVVVVVVVSMISGTKVKVIGNSIEKSFSGRHTKFFLKFLKSYSVTVVFYLYFVFSILT